jgi:hypothetical protein
MTFREFWPLYLQAHSEPGTRAVHYGATVIGVGSTAATIVTGEVLLLAGIGVAYALAIGAHAWIEKNRSMVGINPLWGAVADLRMFWLALTGGLAREIEKSRATPRPQRSVVGAGRPALGSVRNQQRRSLIHR